MDFYADIDEALAALKDSAPTLMADVPALAPLAPFLPLLGLAMTSVSIVQGATGSSLQQAVQTVAQHLTPGQADSTILSLPAPAAQPLPDVQAQIAATAAAVAAPTADAAQAAVTTAVAALPGGNGSS
jgi:hypothetical protein